MAVQLLVLQTQAAFRLRSFLVKRRATHHSIRLWTLRLLECRITGFTTMIGGVICVRRDWLECCWHGRD